MTQKITQSRKVIQHQQRLRTGVKRLVIELGYLEDCLQKGMNDINLSNASTNLDTAIDCLNEYLS